MFFTHRTVNYEKYIYDSYLKGNHEQPQMNPKGRSNGGNRQALQVCAGQSL